MDNVILFPAPNVMEWIASRSGICPCCRLACHLKPDHRRIYDLRCMNCGHEFDMRSGERALEVDQYLYFR